MDLLNKLVLLKNGSISTKEFNDLINYTISVALSYLKIKKAAKYFNLSDDVQTLEDIASESIVQLFTKSSNGEFGIIKSYRQWHKPLVTEANVQFFVNRLVMSRVEQTIPKKLKERDPFFGKILGNVNVIPEKENLKKFHISVVYLL